MARLYVEMTDELKEKIRKYCVNKNMTIKQFVNMVLEKFFEKEKV